jgi:hypothetical protein
LLCNSLFRCKTMTLQWVYHGCQVLNFRRLSRVTADNLASKFRTFRRTAVSCVCWSRDGLLGKKTNLVSKENGLSKYWRSNYAGKQISNSFFTNICTSPFTLLNSQVHLKVSYITHRIIIFSAECFQRFRVIRLLACRSRHLISLFLCHPATLT